MKTNLLYFLCTVLVFFQYCTPKVQVNTVHHTRPADTIPGQTEDYSKLKIDSALIIGLVTSDITLDSFVNPIMDFYSKRNFQAAWYTDSSLSTPAYNFIVRIKEYITAFADSSILDHRLMFLGDSIGLDTILPYAQNDQEPVIDVLLTAVFFKYAEREYYGTEKSIRDLEWYIPRKKTSYIQLLNTMVRSGSYETEPINPMYSRLKRELIRYRKIEQEGGLPYVKEDKALKKGTSSEAVKQLKQYFIRTGYYPVNDTSTYFSDTLSGTVKNFQERMGLEADGKLGKATFAELNVPVQTRIRQLMINMERLRWAPDKMPDDYLLVNIPEFRLHVFEKGEQLWAMNTIVGNYKTATSIFMERLRVVIFNPYWNVPTSIINKELLPKLKADSSYLDHLNMEVIYKGDTLDPHLIDWKSYEDKVPFTIRQKPGKENSLGTIMFMFPNRFDIYMHDTPVKSLFDQNSRAFSHGCIRLSDPQKLALYVLRNDTSVYQENIDKWIEKGEEMHISVKPSIPVIIWYFTAWVDEEGNLNFRKDIYGLDKKLGDEILAK